MRLYFQLSCRCPQDFFISGSWNTDAIETLESISFYAPEQSLKCQILQVQIWNHTSYSNSFDEFDGTAAYVAIWGYSNPGAVLYYRTLGCESSTWHVMIFTSAEYLR
ncbi:unnamed protein product [Victoria cruziana]